jgi:hypothetical protein
VQNDPLYPNQPYVAPVLIPGDDAYYAVREASRAAWYANPSFCNSPSQDDYERFKATGELPKVNLSRHPDAKNPTQCEIAFFTDLVTLKGYREDPWSIGKNVAAGIVNSAIPGSDLGDASSSGQIVGQLIGSFTSVFVDPFESISKLVSFNPSGVLGTILKSPLTSSIVGALLTPQVQQYFPQSVQPATSPANSGTPPATLVYSDSNRTISTGTDTKSPNVILYLVFGLVVLVVGAFAWVLSRGKSRKK